MKNKIKQFNLCTEPDKKAYLDLINNPAVEVVSEKTEFTLDGQYLVLLHYTINPEMIASYAREFRFDYAVLDLSCTEDVELFEEIYDYKDVVKASFHFVKKQGFFLVAVHFKEHAQVTNYKIAKIKGRR